MTIVYGAFDRAALDREYSPSSRAPDFLRTLDQAADRSRRARADLACRPDVRYGPDPAERLDYFPATRPGAPLFVFVHGGHWQQCSKEESAFAAPRFVSSGAAFAALGYGLAPGNSLAEMVASVRRALRWLGEHADVLGHAGDAVYAGGSSAGAHLVAAALSGPEAGPRVPGVCLLSGVYDLQPIRSSYVNDALGLDRETAERYSPLRAGTLAARSVIIARGADETFEYARQQREFVQMLQARKHPVRDLVVVGRNHFDLPFDLGRVGTSVGDAVLAQMGLSPPAARP
ncbi:alpha/beta hydrolase [Embleya hyalina]|uniref:Esterase n=1 Tax=Embleya hyalina TaxID=516124 RepID=A0A401Z634_9ACTN|nr:alpha/beta hydrolase [Embleya hyalina]GCE02305.1 esterase [Embleya hyalina]